MKKLLLSAFAVFFVFGAFAQQSPNVVVSILPPSEFAGNLDHTYAIVDNDWAVGDLEDPLNAVLGTLAVARAEGSVNEDGINNDSCGCEPLTNADEIAGKIAVVYRGDCEFGLKAKNAQDAGAIAVMIVSRLGEELINMLGGTFGMEVTVPTVFTLGDQVINLRPEIDAGNLEAFIGNKNGLFENDLGTNNSLVFRAEYFSQLKGLAQDPGDYPVKVGAFIINYGTNDQTGVTLNAIISKDGEELYSQTTEIPVTIASGDTMLFELPDFSGEPLEEGYYELSYMISSDSEDEFPADNLLANNFMISNNKLSYASIDPETGEVNGRTYYRPSAATSGIHSCIHYRYSGSDPITALGMSFSFTTNGETMEGEVVNIVAYEWESEFENILDPNMELDDNTLFELSTAEYEYIDPDLEGMNVYQDFEIPVTLDPDIRYLFCLNYFSENLFSGHDAAIMDYNINLNYYLQPLFPVQNETNPDGNVWMVGGFGTDIVPAIMVKFDFPDAINEEAQRVDITPFPNPASGKLNIPVGNYYGNTQIDIYDIMGKKVKSLNVTTTANEVLNVDISDLENGAYIFKMNFEDGSFSNFNVVVNN